MYWLAVSLGVALAAMLVTRGSPTRLLARLEAKWLVVPGLGIQVALELVDLSDDRREDVGFGLLMLSYGLLLGFCLVNLRVGGMPILAAGVAMNTLVIGLNDGMPTRDREVTARSGREVEEPVERTVKERPESHDDLLPFLGQVVPLPDNRLDHALSPGDLVIAAGVVVMAVAGSRQRRRAPAAERPAETRAAARAPNIAWSPPTRARSAAEEWEEWRAQLRARIGDAGAPSEPDERAGR